MIKNTINHKHNKVNKNYRLLTKIQQYSILQMYQMISLTVEELNVCILDIQNIQIFTGLQVLSLSHNHIYKLTNIRYLSALQLLKHVSFEGNPIAHSPIYLPYIIGITYENNNRQSLKYIDKINLNQTNQILKDNPPHSNTYPKHQYYKYWQIYCHILKQLVTNYIRMSYLLKYSKQYSIHRTIQSAYTKAQHKKQQSKIYNNINKSYNCQRQGMGIDDTDMGIDDTNRIMYRIQCIMRYVDNDRLDMQDKYIMKIENILSQDIHRLVYSAYNNNNNYNSYSYRQKYQHINHNLYDNQSGNYQNFEQQYIYICESQNNSRTSSISNKPKYPNKTKSINRNIQQQHMNNYSTNTTNKPNKPITKLDSYIQSMSILLQKQNKKLQQMKSKLIKKSQSQSQTSTPAQIQDINTLSIKFGNLLYPSLENQSKQYYQWKLILKIFNSMRLYTGNRNRMKYAVTTIARILKNQVRFKYLDGLQKIKKYAIYNKIMNMVKIIQRKQSQNFFQLFNAMKQFNKKLSQKQYKKIKQIATQQQNYEQDIQQKQQQEQLVNRFRYILSRRNILHQHFCKWFNFANITKLQKNNNLYIQQIQQHKLREQKFINKINLLQKLLQITENKLKQKQHEVQTNYFSSNSQSLVKLIQKDCDNLINQKRIMINSRVSESTSSQKSRIRKNSGYNKQNIHPNIIYNNNLSKIQRKFNSSQKVLKIRNNKS